MKDRVANILIIAIVVMCGFLVSMISDGVKATQPVEVQQAAFSVREVSTLMEYPREKVKADVEAGRLDLADMDSVVRYCGDRR